jgi:flavin-binding protein dodecin
MAVAKVIELLAQSEESWEDAAQQALEEASKTIRNIEHIYVRELQAVVEDGKIAQYRLNCKVTFLVDR